MCVPASNLVGKENEGFKYVMHNFSHERWGFVVQADRVARVCYEEAFKYAHRRRTFGKKLIEHPVIRAKLADIQQIDATHAQMETITYQDVHDGPRRKRQSAGDHRARQGAVH